MLQPFTDEARIRGDCLVQSNFPDADAREIWIDQKRVIVRFKLETVYAQIGNTDRIRSCRGILITNKQSGIFI